jgi:hypothetical protein
MNAPMVGSWSVEVKDVRPYTIHGDLYYELDAVRLDDAGSTVLTVRLPQHAVSGLPKPGDKLAITFLMGQVTAAKAI